ncbi:MAG: DUF4347 domain-containing protein [Phycisphaerae bacterium]
MMFRSSQPDRGKNYWTSTICLGALLAVAYPAAQSQGQPLLCNKGLDNAGCYSACDADSCDAECSESIASKAMEPAQNFTLQLAIVQGPKICNVDADCPDGGTCLDDGPGPSKICSGKTDKINRFQEGVRDTLLKKGLAKDKIKGVNDIKEAIIAINADFTAKGSPAGGIDVAIFGHSAPGYIKVGETKMFKNTAALNEPIDQFLALSGKIKTLTLFGCEVAGNADGRQLVQDLHNGLGRIPVKAWTGRVYAYPQNEPIVPAERRGKLFHQGDKHDKAIPTVSEWGMMVMGLLLFTVATIVIRRSRRAAAA